MVSPYLMHRRKAFRVGWTPAQITTALWLDAADSTTLFDATSGGSLVGADVAIARWEDKSGNARHFTQASIGNRPIRKVSNQNGKDGVQFDGSNDWIERVGLQLGLINRTIFVVVKENAVSINAGFISLKPTINNDWNQRDGLIFGTSERVSFNRIAITGSTSASYEVKDTANISVQLPAIIYGEVKNTASGSLFRNGTSIFTDSSFTEFLPLSSGGVNLGARYSPNISSPYFNGLIFEVVYCESALSTDDRQKLEGYLAHKWGLTADLPADHPYKTVAP